MWVLYNDQRINNYDFISCLIPPDTRQVCTVCYFWCGLWFNCITSPHFLSYFVDHWSHFAKCLSIRSKTFMKTLDRTDNTFMKTLDRTDNTFMKTLDRADNTVMKTLDRADNTLMKTLDRINVKIFGPVFRRFRPAPT